MLNLQVVRARRALLLRQGLHRSRAQRARRCRRRRAQMRTKQSQLLIHYMPSDIVHHTILAPNETISKRDYNPTHDSCPAPGGGARVVCGAARGLGLERRGHAGALSRFRAALDAVLRAHRRATRTRTPGAKSAIECEKTNIV